MILYLISCELVHLLCRQMRPANCNTKQLTHLERKKKKNPFVQYVTTSLKERTFLVVSTESLFKLCETFSWNIILSLCHSQGKTKVYGSVILYRGWEQLEVTCNPIVHHNHNLWNVEGHENDRGNNIFNIYQVSTL